MSPDLLSWNPSVCPSSSSSSSPTFWKEMEVSIDSCFRISVSWWSASRRANIFPVSRSSGNSRIVGCLEMVNTRKHSNFNGEYYEYKFRGTLFSDNYIILYVFEKQLLVKHRNNLMNLRDYERIISTTCAQHHNLQLLETHRQTAFTWHRTCSGPSI